mmetsp:Transcript_33178/g.75081  ORF Transcript_33178/g.75081 Transcript_33178/m.75081 type:complete len:140 (+) Transcript_33178:257-676(+)
MSALDVSGVKFERMADDELSPLLVVVPDSDDDDDDDDPSLPPPSQTMHICMAWNSDFLDPFEPSLVLPSLLLSLLEPDILLVMADEADVPDDVVPAPTEMDCLDPDPEPVPLQWLLDMSPLSSSLPRARAAEVLVERGT